MTRLILCTPINPTTIVYSNDLKFRTDKSWQTVQTQIRLLLEEQSDQGLHCLQFQPHIFDPLTCSKMRLFQFYDNYSNVLGVQSFRSFMVANNGKS